MFFISSMMPSPTSGGASCASRYTVKPSRIISICSSWVWMHLFGNTASRRSKWSSRLSISASATMAGLTTLTALLVFQSA